jgi:hypothetical protein
MAFSSGVFTRLYSWATDKTNGVKITASRMDAEMNGMATGLSTCILKDGTQTTTAVVPFAAGLSVGTSFVSTAPNFSVTSPLPINCFGHVGRTTLGSSTSTIANTVNQAQIWTDDNNSIIFNVYG